MNFTRKFDVWCLAEGMTCCILVTLLAPLSCQSLADRQQKLLKLGSQLTDKAAQNAEVVRHSVALGRVLQEQTRLTVSMGNPKEVVTR